jgi:hypothetical protein
MSGIILGPVAKASEGSKTSTAGVVAALSTDTRSFRTVIVVPKSTNTDSVLCGLSATDPKMEAPFQFPEIQGKFYRLDQIYIKPVVNGEGVNFIGFY